MLPLTTMLWLSIFLGTTAAAAALYGRYKTLPAFLTGPTICQLEAGGCSALFRTKEASLLGGPNAFFGIALYLFLAVGLSLKWSIPLLILAASGGLGMSVYLASYLIKNRLQCRVCWLGHFSNAIIWLVLCTKLLVPGVE